MIRLTNRLIVYLTCGDPSLSVSRAAALAAIDAGADVLELGVPFSDPVADGPVIQRASERALRHGTTLRQVIGLGAELRRERPHAGLIVFSYLNPILRMGYQGFAGALAAAGIDGALVTDLTAEESGDYRAAMRGHGLDTIFLVAPTSPEERLRAIAKVGTGFIYAVSRTGVTGGEQAELVKVKALVKRVRKHTALPVAVGFGIADRQQFAAITRVADAAVIGSALVKRIEENPGREAVAVKTFIESLHG